MIDFMFQQKAIFSNMIFRQVYITTDVWTWDWDLPGMPQNI